MKRLLILCATLGLTIGCASKVSPPTAVATVVGGLTSVMTGAVVQLDGSKSTDPQGLPLTFRWWLQNVPAGSRAKLDSTSVTSPSFVADMTGAYVVALVVSDSVFPSSAATITVNAEPCGGHSPVVTSIVFTQGAVSETSLNDNASPDGGSGSLDGGATDGGADAGVADAGVADAGVVDGGAVDGGAARDGGTAADAGPKADAGSSDAGAAADAGAADGGADGGSGPLFRELTAVSLSATVVDPDTDPASCTPTLPAVFTYAWSLQAPAGSASVLSSVTAASPTFTPDVQGDYTVAVTVTDLNGHTGPVQSSVLTVADCGDHSPEVKLTASSAAATLNGVSFGTAPAGQVGAPITLTAQSYDPDNGVLASTGIDCDPTKTNQTVVTVGWTFVSRPFGSSATMVLLPTDPSSIIPGKPVPATAMFTPDVSGAYLIQLTATDPTHLTAQPSLISINIAGCTGDDPPVIGAIQAVNAAGNDVTQATVAQPIQFNATVTDADNVDCSPLKTFTYAWTLAGLPAASHAALNGTTLAAPGLVPDVPGQYAVSLVVTDSTGLVSQPLSFSITVVAQTVQNTCGMRPPVITSLLATAANAPWNQVFQVDADNELLPAGDNPACTGAGCTKLFSTDDPDKACVQGLSLSFAWSFDSLPIGSHAAFLNATVQNPSFVPDVANASYIIRLTATDSRGYTATADAEVLVPALGANAPVVQFNTGLTSLAFAPASASTPATISGAQVGDAVGLNLAGCNGSQAQLTDADNSTGSICTGNYGPQTFTYAWTLLSAPAGSAATLRNPTTIDPSIVPDVEGTYGVSVVVTDSTGLSSQPETVDIAVGCGASVKPAVTVTTTPAGTVSVGTAVWVIATVANADGQGYTNTVGGSRVCTSPETFSYAWTILSAPAGSVAALNDSAARTPSFVPDVASGTWYFQVIVTDLQGRSTVATGSVSTSTCGSLPPHISSVSGNAVLNTYGGAISGPSPSVTWDGNGNVTAGAAMFQPDAAVAFDAVVTDPNAACGAAAQTVSYSWALVNVPAGSAAKISSSGSAGSLTPDVPSASATTKDYQFALTATNSSGHSTTAVYGLTVSNCGVFTPTVLNGFITTNGANTVGQVLVFTATSPTTNVLDGNVTSCFPAQFRLPATYDYQWTLAGKPDGSDAELSGASTSSSAILADEAGIYEVTIVVSDASGATSIVNPGAAGPGVLQASVGVCGSEAPDVTIGETDCSLAGSAMICSATQNTPASGGAPYSVCSASPTNCLSVASSYTITLASGNAYLLGSVTPPANNACLPGDTWATMTYDWQMVSLPANSTMAHFANTTAAGALFKPDVTGTYVFTLTVTNILGKSGQASVSVVAQ